MNSGTLAGILAKDAGMKAGSIRGFTLETTKKMPPSYGRFFAESDKNSSGEREQIYGTRNFSWNHCRISSPVQTYDLACDPVGAIGVPAPCLGSGTPINSSQAIVHR